MKTSNKSSLKSSYVLKEWMKIQRYCEKVSPLFWGSNSGIISWKKKYVCRKICMQKNHTDSEYLFPMQNDCHKGVILTSVHPAFHNLADLKITLCFAICKPFKQHSKCIYGFILLLVLYFFTSSVVRSYHLQHAHSP